MTEPHPAALLRQLEQHARRRFGQHFLWRQDIVTRIVSAARVVPEEKVLEIGPGLGILTRALRRAGADVTAVELDRDLAAFLQTELPAVHVIEGDALRMDWPKVCPGSGWKVVANLPYNVGTQLVLQLIALPEIFSSITVMLQREVVDRMLSPPGNKSYGALTVQIAARAEGRFVVAVPPTAFHPKPKVDSAVIQLTLHPKPDAGPAGIESFTRVVRASFAQRRKTVANSLGSMVGKQRATEACVACGIDPRERAEQLDSDAFRRLAAALFPGRSEQTR